MAILGLRPAMLEIVDDRFCDNPRQRIGRGVPRLARQYLKSFALPVNIIQNQLCDLMRPQAIGHQKKQNSIVPSSPNRSSLDCLQHSADLIPADGTWHIVEAIYLWSSHDSAEIPTRDSLAVTEPQQYSQMTTEIAARARSHFRCVLHESGENWRGQLAEASDASLTEVLSKLTQVTTVVSNGTFCESTFAPQIFSKPRNC